MRVKVKIIKENDDLPLGAIKNLKAGLAHELVRTGFAAFLEAPKTSLFMKDAAPVKVEKIDLTDVEETQADEVQADEVQADEVQKLEDLSAAELFALCESQGFKPRKKATKGDLIDLLTLGA